MSKEPKLTEDQKRLMKMAIAKREARLQAIRKTQGGEGVKPKVTLPKFTWDKDWCYDCGMEAPCDYLAVDWSGIPWVRYEECYVINNHVRIGERLEWRVIVKTDQGRCADRDLTLHTRYQISNYEWVCILTKVKPWKNILKCMNWLGQWN